MTLDDVVTMDEAAEAIGRTPHAMRKAAQRGTLEARRLPVGGRGVWITTHDAAARYAARVVVSRRLLREGAYSRGRNKVT